MDHLDVISAAPKDKAEIFIGHEDHLDHRFKEKVVITVTESVPITVIKVDTPEGEIVLITVTKVGILVVEKDPIIVNKVPDIHKESKVVIHVVAIVLITAISIEKTLLIVLITVM